jgi:hypothetical protein
MEPVKLPPGAGVPLNTIQVDFYYFIFRENNPMILGSDNEYTLAIQMGTS